MTSLQLDVLLVHTRIALVLFIASACLQVIMWDVKQWWRSSKVFACAFFGLNMVWHLFSHAYIGAVLFSFLLISFIFRHSDAAPITGTALEARLGARYPTAHIFATITHGVVILVLGALWLAQ